MSEENTVQRDMGRLEGRLASVEAANAEFRAALALARAEHNAELGLIYKKLDDMSAKMNQGIGGLRLGMAIWAAVAAAGGFVVSHLWPLAK